MTSRTTHPSLGELLVVVLAGAAHVVIELSVSESVALACTAGFVTAFGGYLIFRARRGSGALRAWGMRRDNLRRALPAHLGFAAVGAATLLAYGAIMGARALPSTFWLTLLLYPLWGVAQQFALQNLVAKNLEGVIRRPWPLALAAATLFAISHYPRLDLVALTFVAGVFFTRIYRWVSNLWAVGIAHGVLGSLAVYLVLEEDPGADILAWLTGLGAG